MTIIDLLNILLSHLEEVDVEVIKEIASLLGNSNYASYKSIFDSILQYQEIDPNKKLPTSNYVLNTYKGFIIPNDTPLTKEIINILTYSLKKDVTTNKTLMALQSGDLEEAQNILSNNTPKFEFTETKAEDIYSIYQKKKELPPGLKIGVAELDNIYKNFSYGTNNFIAAPQKAGKTTAALSIAYDGFMKQGMKCVYLTLEVQPEDIYYNLYARHAYEIGCTPLNAQKCKKNLLDDDEQENLRMVQESFIECMNESGGKLAVVANHDFPEFTMQNLKKYLEQKYDEWGRVDLVIIDHIGLTGFYPMRGVPDLKERINTWVKYTTDLAKGFHDDGFILITLMQINRQGSLAMRKGKQIGFEVLADSNEAERSCHTCTVMYSNPEMLMSNQVKMYCLANRNGPPLTSDEDDNSITTYLNPSIYLLGHRKFGQTISMKNKHLLREEPKTQLPSGNSLFSSLIGS